MLAPLRLTASETVQNKINVTLNQQQASQFTLVSLEAPFMLNIEILFVVCSNESDE